VRGIDIWQFCLVLRVHNYWLISIKKLTSFHYVLGFFSVSKASSERFKLAGQRKYNTSFRKDISEQSGLNPEISISRFTCNVMSFCQVTVTAVRSWTASGELQNTEANFFFRGGKWIFGTEQTVRFTGKAIQNDQLTAKLTVDKHFHKFLQWFFNDKMT